MTSKTAQALEIITAAAAETRAHTADELSQLRGLLGARKPKAELTPEELAAKQAAFKAGKLAAQKRYKARQRLHVAMLKRRVGEELTEAEAKAIADHEAEQAAADAAKAAADAESATFLPVPAAPAPAAKPRSRRPAAAKAGAAAK
jgi:hypothetical protein